jgi:hypothetical protein
MKPVSKHETGARFMEPEYGRLGEKITAAWIWK